VIASPSPGRSAAPLLPDLTEYEVLALEGRYNLSDGHPHFSPSMSEQRIISDLPQLWRDASRRTQGTIDGALVQALADFHRQPTLLAVGRAPLLAYASSISMGVVSAYLGGRQLSVSLLEPCFDNLYEILRHRGITPSPVPEDVVFSPEAAGEDLQAAVIGDVLIIVDPNNPSGRTSLLDDAARFRQIVEFCSAHGTMLVLDLSFSSFMRSPELPGRPDVYEVLEESGITYITIEDTGKTWPTLDLKCGMIMSSADIHEDVRAIHTGVLLNVSPVSSLIVTEFIRASINEDFRTIPRLLAENRAILQDSLRGTSLRMIDPAVPVSVAWLEILDGRDASDVQAALATADVHVLPGQHFYWAHPARGASFIRVALSRDTGLFSRAVDVLVRNL
jgi:aspartate/methionine/tyrosine aminotransferase